VGTPAPDDEVPWLSPEQKAPLVRLREDPRAAMAELTRMFEALPRDVSTVSAGAADLRALRDGTLRERLGAMLDHAYRNGARGIAADVLEAEVAPWGFPLHDVQVEVIGFYGTEDERVPPVHGAWYAKHLPNGRVIEVPNAGHLAVATAWDEIVSEVARRPQPTPRPPPGLRTG
jgi:pimeloyl-ACP methyl ester carboxylesterase